MDWNLTEIAKWAVIAYLIYAVGMRLFEKFKNSSGKVERYSYR